MNDDNIKKAHKEFKDTKHNLYTSLNEQLGNIVVTKSELEKYREGLKSKNISDDKIEKYVKDYPITKRLQFILHEGQLHEQLDDAISFLDKAILYLTESDSNGKES